MSSRVPRHAPSRYEPISRSRGTAALAAILFAAMALSPHTVSGRSTNTLGGSDAFDTVENALEFAIAEFPNTAAAMNAAFNTRVFDARVAEDASRGLKSPYYF